MLGITTIQYIVLMEFGTRQLIKQLHDIVYKGAAHSSCLFHVKQLLSSAKPQLADAHQDIYYDVPL